MNCYLNQLCLPGYTKLPFKWFDYLRETGSVAAPVKLFNKVNVEDGMVIMWDFTYKCKPLFDQNILEFLSGDLYSKK